MSYHQNIESLLKSAHDIRNVFILAEKVNYPFQSVKYPSLTIILNNLSALYGFTLYSSLKQAVENGSYTQFTLVENPKNTIKNNISIGNSLLSSYEKDQLFVVAKTIFDQIYRKSLSSLESEIISKLQCYKTNQVVSNVLDNLNYADIGISNPVNHVIKKAITSIALHKLEFSDCNPVKLTFDHLIKAKNKEKNIHLTNDLPQFIYERISDNSTFHRYEGIDFTKYKDNTYLTASFSINNEFKEMTRTALLKNLLINTFNHHSDSFNIEILRSILNDNDLLKDHFKINADEVFTHKKITAKILNTCENIIENMWRNKKENFSIEIPPNKTLSGIISHSGLPYNHTVVYHLNDFIRVSDHIQENDKELLLSLSPSQLFWSVQMVASNILETKGYLVESEYIKFCFKNYKYSAYTLNEIETIEFKKAIKIIKKLIGLVA